MTTGSADETNRAMLAYIGTDTDLAQSLQKALRRIGGTLVTKPDRLGALSMVWPKGGATVVVDERGFVASEDLTSVIEELRARLGGSGRIFCLTAIATIDRRLVALRAGADGIFPLPESGYDALSARLADLVRDRASPSRILIIDDEPVAALIAYRVLKKAGMEVSSVSDPRLALDALMTFRPDLILMDLHMPGISGIELTRLIRDDDELHGLPIIFLSGEMDPDMRMETLRVGGNDFLAKPVTPDRLIAAVQDRLRHARGRPPKTSATPLRNLVDQRILLSRIERAIADPKGDKVGQGLLLIAPDTEPGIDHTNVRAQDGFPPADLADGLAACLAPSDTFSLIPRLGLAVLAQRGDLAGLISLGERLQEAAKGPASDESNPLARLCIGLAPFDIPADDALTVLSRGESALKEARRAGSQRIVVHSAAVSRQENGGGDAQLLKLVEQALRNDHFELYYQPIIPLRQGGDKPYDVRLRLRAPNGEFVPAFDFIPAAQRAGLLPAIDRWVLEQALAAFQEGLSKQDGLRFVIHQDLATLEDPNWIDSLRDRIVSHGLVKQRPLLRFNGEQFVAHLAMVQDTLEALRRLGIGICVDHFVDLPIFWTAIEQSSPTFVRIDFQQVSHQGSETLSSLVTRLHRCGAQVLIANIEEPTDIGQIWTSGADLIQGNFVQPPNPKLSYDFLDTILE